MLLLNPDLLISVTFSTPTGGYTHNDGELVIYRQLRSLSFSRRRLLILHGGTPGAHHGVRRKACESLFLTYFQRKFAAIQGHIVQGYGANSMFVFRA
ncbi:MAG: hypothetical protein AUH15_01195 [Acidobacteriales bacterium 13_2_20CM_55_8]|jgi:hypothetical protein|nr:MAG: hypothetical protein AUH15_01195 [Acidobacteriales bacterium 13_2_20CM_55_8]